MQEDPILSYFGVESDALLGFGGESRVYALNADQVLRVYETRADRGYVERLRQFYDQLARHMLPFEIPQVENIDVHEDVLYALEKRIDGTRLTDFLKAAEGAEREGALARYLDVAEAIETIPFDASEFGELLNSKPITRTTWPEYLRDRMQFSEQFVDEQSAAEVPRLQEIIDRWIVDLSSVSDVAQPKLVHGDYFPGNVMAGKDGLVTAVIDFSPMSVAGDPRLDVVCALIFMEVDAGYRPEDSRYLQRLIAKRHGDSVIGLLDLYRTFYSLYFLPVRKSDPKLYKWCVANLNRYFVREAS